VTVFFLQRTVCTGVTDTFYFAVLSCVCICMSIMANNESVLKKHFDGNKVPEALLTLIMQGLKY